MHHQITRSPDHQCITILLCNSSANNQVHFLPRNNTNYFLSNRRRKRINKATQMPCIYFAKMWHESEMGCRYNEWIEHTVSRRRTCDSFSPESCSRVLFYCCLCEYKVLQMYWKEDARYMLMGQPAWQCFTVPWQPCDTFARRWQKVGSPLKTLLPFSEGKVGAILKKKCRLKRYRCYITWGKYR